jgi:hypothetical protein
LEYKLLGTKDLSVKKVYLERRETSVLIFLNEYSSTQVHLYNKVNSFIPLSGEITGNFFLLFLALFYTFKIYYFEGEDD